jgi:nicotinate-nucleotide adenylyltransferase
MIEISSSFIREGIRDGKNMSQFLPEKVWEYIEEMHFYQDTKI